MEDMPKNEPKKRGRPPKKAEPKAEEPEKPFEGFPNVKPPSLEKRNLPKPPKTIRVCGNTIPVINGHATEADPKVLRARALERARKRGLGPEEERI